MSSQHRCRSFHVMAWFCAFALVSVPACGGDADTGPTEKPAAHKADSGESDQSRGGGGSRAKGRDTGFDIDIPEDVPIYSGGKIVNAAPGKRGGLSITVETDDPVSEVATEMTSSLEKAGWNSQGVDRDGSYFIIADKGKRSLTVLIESRRPGTTRINIMAL